MKINDTVLEHWRAEASAHLKTLAEWWRPDCKLTLLMHRHGHEEQYMLMGNYEPTVEDYDELARIIEKSKKEDL